METAPYQLRAAVARRDCLRGGLQLRRQHFYTGPDGDAAGLQGPDLLLSALHSLVAAPSVLVVAGLIGLRPVVLGVLPARSQLLFNVLD